MSKRSTRQVDLKTRLSLVAKIRCAAQLYRAEPAKLASAALRSYVAALECVPNHVETKCRGPQLFHRNSLLANRIPAAAARIAAVANPAVANPAVAHSRARHRVLQFPAPNSSSGWPLPAA